MKIKLYILTYNSEYHLNSGLETLFSTDLSQHQIEIYVINNHTNYNLYKKFENKVITIHNILQPDFGTGHCSRNWNQAIIHGFHSLINPDCDLVICAQDDTEYLHNWLNLLVHAHTAGYEFIACGIGDNLCSYTPIGVKYIGLWDERYCALHYAEHDYFLRAAMWLGDNASINDVIHNGVYLFNPLPFKDQIIYRPMLEGARDTLRNERQQYVNICKDLFIEKWGDIPEKMPVRFYSNQKRSPMIPSPLFYPYFERDVYNLKEKGYHPIFTGEFACTQ